MTVLEGGGRFHDGEHPARGSGSPERSLPGSFLRI